jgi:hypothetical protein
VEQGGATVFPTAGGHVKPKKGTAAFWYNLYASGEGKLIIFFILIVESIRFIVQVITRQDMLVRIDRTCLHCIFQ